MYPSLSYRVCQLVIRLDWLLDLQQGRKRATTGKFQPREGYASYSHLPYILIFVYIPIFLYQIGGEVWVMGG